MNPHEVEGLREILSCLSLDHLKEIAMITTSHMMDEHYNGVQSPELVNEIIKSASTASEILHRQKVSKELLLKYLRSKGFNPDPKSVITRITQGVKAQCQDFINETTLPCSCSEETSIC